MKRWRGILLRVCVFALLGAIVNVAVAWCIAANVEHGDRTFITTTGSGAVYTGFEFAEHQFGWPLRCMLNDPEPQECMPRRTAWMVGEIALPLLPRWPGFASNTLLYAAVFWAIFAMPFAMRRRSRIKRGLCANCGYDLRGRSVEATRCTECGQPVR